MTKSTVLFGLCLLGAVFLWLLSPANAPKTPASELSLSEQVAVHSAIETQRPSQRFIATQDLPPAGSSSLFDQHIAGIGALPYPFSALLDSLKPLDRWRQGSVSLLIPDGRSLAKGHADYHQPRVLAAAQLDPLPQDQHIAPLYSGRLFLGFVEAINTIEIIAYNETAGRFEFQLVHDYCDGCEPRISYAKRAICLACHQSGSPIFSVRPWGETNAHRPVAERIAQAQNIAWSQASTQAYHGASVSTQILMPETFDELVQLGGSINLAQRFWLDGCGEDGLLCRRALLNQALFLLLEPGAFDPESADNLKLRDLQAKHWPTHGIELADDSIPSRSPAPRPSALQRLQRHIQRLWETLRYDTATNDPTDARLAAFERLPRLPVELDPLRPREAKERLSSDTVQSVQAVAKMFSVHDRALLRQMTLGQPERISQLISSGKLDEILGPSPLNRVAILQRLNTLLGQAPLAYCCNSVTGPAHTEPVQTLAIEANSVLQLFQKYCFACHRGNPVEQLNFMGADSATAVLKHIRETPRIQSVLNYAKHAQTEKSAQLMPPPHSLQRALLDADRAAGAKDLQRMLEAINRE